MAGALQMRRYSIFGGNDYFLSVEDRLWQAIRPTIRIFVQLHTKKRERTWWRLENQKPL